MGSVRRVTDHVAAAASARRDNHPRGDEDPRRDDDPRRELRADCSRCIGLCCTIFGFSRSADFAMDKAPRTPCPNLLADFRCGIHDRLRPLGFAGCTVYDCLGAGQRVVQEKFPGQDVHGPEVADAMVAAFTVLEELHGLLWYLADAAQAAADDADRRAVAELTSATERMAALDGAELGRLATGEHRRAVEQTLQSVSARSRQRCSGPRQDHHGADLSGAHLAGADLRGADLSRADLSGADLRGADLRGADLLVAELRGADLSGADLSGCLYATTMQVHGARGDTRTVLPAAVHRPPHWASR
jgi:uncharacterized protein YjbI with pentapeptide repeats